MSGHPAPDSVATPAALGVATLGVLGGSLVAPSSSTPEASLAPRPAVVALDTRDVADWRGAIADVTQPAGAAPQAAAAPAAPPAAVPAAEVTTSLEDVGLRDTCSGAAGARAGGVSCRPEGDPVLHVGPPLPSNPTGIGRLGVETNKIECEQLPTLPMTECTTTEGDSR